MSEKICKFCGIFPAAPIGNYCEPCLSIGGVIADKLLPRRAADMPSPWTNPEIDAIFSTPTAPGESESK